MQPELCLENHTPQSSPVSEVEPAVPPAPPPHGATAGSVEDRKRSRWIPGPNVRQSHPLHRTWANMIQRCYNPHNTAYQYYGGRGIAVCDRWRDFMLFLEDVGPRPSPKHTLERVDNDGNYCRENVRWATRLEQSQNMRSNHRLEHNGEILTIAEWSRRLGVLNMCIPARLRRGWSLHDALTIPPKK
jgi:hypothetical protein